MGLAGADAHVTAHYGVVGRMGVALLLNHIMSSRAWIERYQKLASS